MEKNIKICGVRSAEIADAAINAGASHIGFIFFEKSPRNIPLEDAAFIARHIQGRAAIVMVVVNPADDFLVRATALFTPDYIQLHGSETPERVKEIRDQFSIKIIKAIPLKEKNDLAQAKKFKNIADYILFDAKPAENATLPGGNAVSFDWNILDGFKADYPWILSGGLDKANVNNALILTKADFLDVSSGVESSPGMKQIALITEFIAAANNTKIK